MEIDMKKTAAVLTALMSISAMANATPDALVDGEIGNFSYERDRSHSKSCVYDYVDSNRISVITQKKGTSCSATVSDLDVFPNEYYAKGYRNGWREARMNYMNNLYKNYLGDTKR